MTTKGARTRARILEEADHLLRQQGLEALGVAKVMQAAGLTVGGFYAHFRDRANLAAEAVRRSFQARREATRARYADLGGASFLEAWIERYLTVGHRDHPRLGCPLRSVTSEIPHQDPEVQQAFQEGIASMLEFVAERSGDEQRLPPQQLAAGLVALGLGGVSLARALPPQEAEELLEGCRAFARLALSEGATPTAGADGPAA